ncbi:hypothetical protein M8845_18755 [Gelidibacter japonicus]|uniref:hypothetical protein n=1 Tax=Gelidibacter japonicus TaxID=1962232 RepID=UPI00201FC914|nr:hypothetical protein [Gelidibacter japonicus]MCL8009468.1 hypothetical protein [Gelidibacter japonicus]
MKKNILIKSIIIFLTLTIYSCENSKTEKTELVYENGNQKVEIQILNGNDYLEYDKLTETNFMLTNIEPNTFSVYGAGIRVLGTKNGTMKTEIKVPSNYLETDTLNVKVRFGIKPEENHEFNIPMKTAE